MADEGGDDGWLALLESVGRQQIGGQNADLEDEGENAWLPQVLVVGVRGLDRKRHLNAPLRLRIKQGTSGKEAS